MSKIINGVFYAQTEPPANCELCGKADEVRPYGPNGENVCFACMKKNEPAALARFKQRLEAGGATKVVLVEGGNN